MRENIEYPLQHEIVFLPLTKYPQETPQSPLDFPDLLGVLRNFGMLKPYNVHNCGHKNCMKLITPEEVTAQFARLAR